MKEIELIKTILKENNISFFSPKDENCIAPDADYISRQKGFERNMREIEKCDFMIANTRDKDMGVCIEMGSAYTLKKPVILFCPQVEGKPINLMLAQLCNGLSFNEYELKCRINELLFGLLSPQFRGLIE